MTRIIGESSATRSKTLLHEYLAYGGFGRCETEYRFHPERKWRADFALLDQRPPVLIEYDGLMRHGENMGHASINGILRDVEKINHAQALGYRVYRGNAKTIQDGSFFTLLDTALMRVKEGVA